MRALYTAATALTFSSPLAAQVTMIDIEQIADSIAASENVTIPTKTYELLPYETLTGESVRIIGELIGICARTTEAANPETGILRRGYVVCKDNEMNFKGFGVSLEYTDGTLLLIDDFSPTDAEVDYCTLVVDGESHPQVPASCQPEFNMAVFEKLGKRLIT